MIFTQCVNRRKNTGREYVKTNRAADLWMILTSCPIWSKFLIMNMHCVNVQECFSSRSCHQKFTGPPPFNYSIH